MSGGGALRAESDAVLAAVVGNRLKAIAEQMAEAMLRSSRSPIFSQSRDFVTGIFDAEGRWVATKEFIPVLAGSMPAALEAIRARFGDDLAEGDVFALNDPYHGGNHPPDITVVKPVFYAGRVAFWAMSKGHNVDVGNAGPMGYDPYATDCWEDGLRIPPVRLWRGGARQQDVWDLIVLNVRMQALVAGDLECQVGAVTIGERALQELVAKFGRERVERATEFYLEACAADVREQLAGFPDGTYRAERQLDNGGAGSPDPVTIRLELTLADGRARFDLTGSDPQTSGYVNSPHANSQASCYVGLFAIVSPPAGMNGGATAVTEVITKPGTVTGAIEPAATNLCTLATCEAIVECVWAAFAQADAARSNSAWARFCGFASSGFDERLGRPYAIMHSFTQGGGGATEGYDGWDVIGTPVVMGGGCLTDTELGELTSPFRVLDFRFAQDSAGSGRWRGGVGGVQRWMIEQDGLRLVYYGGGNGVPTVPYGLEGGGSGSLNWAELHRADGSVERAVPNSIVSLNRGDVVAVHCGGGGGYGDAFERDPRAVLDDVLDGFVSVDAAETVYGVSVDLDAEAVDEQRTASLRGSRRAIGAAR